ncbi:MAG: hypothetical protein KDB17_02565, partial [Ilumatobacter sp.]|nr:hypothetical protein [Ilumatobacter sp.]
APDWAAYRRALAGAVRRAGPPPEPAVRVSGLLLQDDVHLLAVDSPWLCSVAAHFAHTAPAVTRTDGIRLKDRLHLSLAYGFDPAAAGELGGLAEEWVDPLAPASWQIRLYHRRAGAEWIVRESLDVGSRQV